MGTQVSLFWVSRMDGRSFPKPGARMNETRPFRDLLEGFGHRRKDARRGKEALPCVRPGPVEKGDKGLPGPQGGRPAEWHTGRANIVVLDIDNKDGLISRDHVSQWQEVLEGVEHAVWETASSTPDHPRYRVAVPLDPGCRAPGDRHYAAVCEALASLLGMTEDQYDRAGTRAGQVMALPAEVNLDGREPETWYRDGRWFSPTVDEVVTLDPRPVTSRSWDDMSLEEQAFNSRYASDGPIGLGGLPEHIVEQMGCRYVREGAHWKWVSLDGETASQAGVFASSEVPGAYVDMYASSPLCGRVAYPLDIVVFQSALSRMGLDTLDDEAYRQARRRYADPVKEEERRTTRAGMFSPAPQAIRAPSSEPEAPAQAQAPSEVTLMPLADAAYRMAPVKRTKGGDVVQVDRVTGRSFAPRLEPFSRVLQDVYVTPSGAPVRRRGGDTTTVAGQEAKALLSDLLVELCPVAPEYQPGENIPSDPSQAFLEAMLQSRMGRREAHLQDERVEALDRCVREWHAAGSPEPEALFSRAPGVRPSGDTSYDWAVWKRLWMLAAHRVLRPGSKVGSVLPFLTGGQRAGKNELAGALAGESISWFPESQMLVSDASVLGYRKDQPAAETLLKASSKMVLLMDEVQGLGNREAATSSLKNFATTSTYAVTPKYLGTMDLKRSFLTLAAANNAAQGLVPADEGYRRYMVVPMVSFDDTGSGSGSSEAYAELSRLVSPDSREKEHLNTMLLGWATSVVRAAVDQDDEYGVLDRDFDLGGRWQPQVMAGLLPVFSHRDVLADLLRAEPQQDRVLVRSVLGRDAGSTRKAAFRFWVRTALGGDVDLSGEVARVDPARLREWRSRLFDEVGLALFQKNLGV